MKGEVKYDKNGRCFIVWEKTLEPNAVVAVGKIGGKLTKIGEAHVEVSTDGKSVGFGMNSSGILSEVSVLGNRTYQNEYASAQELARVMAHQAIYAKIREHLKESSKNGRAK